MHTGKNIYTHPKSSTKAAGFMKSITKVVKKKVVKYDAFNYDYRFYVK